jgi:hypothetical protein
MFHYILNKLGVMMDWKLIVLIYMLHHHHHHHHHHRVAAVVIVVVAVVVVVVVVVVAAVAVVVVVVVVVVVAAAVVVVVVMVVVVSESSSVKLKLHIFIAISISKLHAIRWTTEHHFIACNIPVFSQLFGRGGDSNIMSFSLVPTKAMLQLIHIS